MKPGSCSEDPQGGSFADSPAQSLDPFAGERGDAGEFFGRFGTPRQIALIAH